MFTDLSVELRQRGIAAVHASAGGQGALGGRGHGLPLGAVAASRQLPAQSAAVLGGRACREEEEKMRREGGEKAEEEEKESKVKKRRRRRGRGEKEEQEEEEEKMEVEVKEREEEE